MVGSKTKNLNYLFLMAFSFLPNPLGEYLLLVRKTNIFFFFFKVTCIMLRVTPRA